MNQFDKRRDEIDDDFRRLSGNLDFIEIAYPEERTYFDSGAMRARLRIYHTAALTAVDVDQEAARSFEPGQTVWTPTNGYAKIIDVADNGTLICRKVGESFRIAREQCSAT